MELAKCMKCKNVFPKIREPICEACLKDEETMFETVREYLRDNPKVTVGEVSEATGVSTKKIFGYLRDGRIEIAEGGGLNCNGCGEPIKSGQLCKECFEKANAKIQGMINKNAPPPPEKNVALPTGNKAGAMRGRR